MSPRPHKYPVPLRPEPDPSWPAEWQQAYAYDCLEVWGEQTNLGYTASYYGRRNATLDAVQTYCQPRAKILDLAAASGNFTIALAAAGHDVAWNDLRSSLIDYVKLKQPGGTRVDYIAGNIFELPIDHTAGFDLVLATEVIEHVAHPDEFLAKIATLVRPGGHIVLSTPNGGYFLNDLPRFSDHPDPAVFESVQFKPNSDGHIFLLYEDEIRSLAARAGLQVKHLRLITNPLTAGHIKLRYLLRVLPHSVVDMLESATRRAPEGLRQTVSTQIIAVLARPSPLILTTTGGV